MSDIIGHSYGGHLVGLSSVGMIQYRDIKQYNNPKMKLKPFKKIPEVIALLLVMGIVAIVILFSLTHGGLAKTSEFSNVQVQRTFTGRKPKVFRTSDIDIDPLRIASPYYIMKIPPNSTCVERVPAFSETKLPLTALVSYPGSGSTWLRHIVQQLTGVATGSSTCQKELKTSKSFSLGECINDKHVILVNTHDKYKRKKFEKKFDKLIILYRDPFDTLRSAYTMKHPGHSESVDSEIFNVRGWYEFIRDHTTLLEQYYTEWLEAERPIFLLFYDDLQNNLPVVLKKLAYFLEWRVTKKDIKCTVVTSEGHFHRRHVHNITNSEIFIGKLAAKLQEAELNIADVVEERRQSGKLQESGNRLKNVVIKANEENKEDTSL